MADGVATLVQDKLASDARVGIDDDRCEQIDGGALRLAIKRDDGQHLRGGRVRYGRGVVGIDESWVDNNDGDLWLVERLEPRTGGDARVFNEREATQVLEPHDAVREGEDIAVRKGERLGLAEARDLEREWGGRAQRRKSRMLIGTVRAPTSNAAR